MLNLPAIQREKPVLSDLLEAFQPNKIPDSVLSDIQPNILPGTVEYLYLGAYSYLESVLNTGINSDMFPFVGVLYLFLLLFLTILVLASGSCSVLFFLYSGIRISSYSRIYCKLIPEYSG